MINMENRKIAPPIKREMINFMLENYDKSINIKEFCDKVLRETQLEYLKNPSVYLSTLTDKNGNRYLTAKTLFPVAVDKFKEHRYYVGTIKEYPNGVKDERGKMMGKKILKQKLNEKYKTLTHENI